MRAHQPGQACIEAGADDTLKPLADQLAIAAKNASHYMTVLGHLSIGWLWRAAGDGRDSYGGQHIKRLEPERCIPHRHPEMP